MDVCCCKHAGWEFLLLAYVTQQLGGVSQKAGRCSLCWLRTGFPVVRSGTYVCVGVHRIVGVVVSEYSQASFTDSVFAESSSNIDVSPQTSIHSSFTVTWDTGRNSPVYLFPTEVEQGDGPRSCFILMETTRGWGHEGQGSVGPEAPGSRPAG